MHIDKVAEEERRVNKALFFSTDELVDGGYATDVGYDGVIEDFKTKMIYRCTHSVYWYRVVDEVFDIRVLRTFIGLAEAHRRDHLPPDFQAMQEMLGDVYFISSGQHPDLSFIEIIRKSEALAAQAT
jgi:hypothetical protein